MIKGPLAAIDIGTNTFRLLIGHLYLNTPTNTFTLKELFSDRVITRLGEGLDRNGFMMDVRIRKSIEVLKNFSTVISSFKVMHTSAIATSALRNAKNSSDFVLRAKEETGLSIEVISGEREARLSASGMLIDMPIPSEALLLDIGGGSTELILLKDGQPEFIQSVELGVVYLASGFMKNDPLSPEDIHQMETDITDRIASIHNSFKKRMSRNTVLIGTAGTITTLATIAQGLTEFDHHKIHNFGLNIDKVNSISSKLVKMSTKERSLFIPFESERLDIIVPGTLILLRLMQTFKFHDIVVSNYGLREGILIDLYKKEFYSG